MKCNIVVLFIFSILASFVENSHCVNMDQFKSSLNMMRSVCMPKHKVTVQVLDDLRKGVFLEDRDLKCYTKCIAQTVGTLNKKGELSSQKMRSQIDIILPPELRDLAKQAVEHCKDVQNNYKDSCEKSFYTTKCIYEFSPENFHFP